MEVYLINVKNISYDNEINYLLKYVDEKKREKALRYIHEKDRIRTLIGDILVRSYMAKNYKYINSDIKYEYNKFNKPSLKNSHDIYFNISHSGDYVCAAFDNEAVGIDVEKIKKTEFENIAESSFTEKEFLRIMKQEEDNRIKEFYKLWTLKESYVKFKGRGLSIPLDSFSFKYNSESDTYSLENNDEKLNFNNYDIGDSYELSFCSKKNKVSIKEISYKDLVNDINTYLK